MSEYYKNSATVQEKVYIEAGNWVRLANTVIWTTGSIFVPTSFGALWIAGQNPRLVPVCAITSILLVLVWLGIFRIYAQTAREARNALIAVEEQWELEEKQRFYSRHQKLVSKSFNVLTLQVLVLTVLVIVWVWVWLGVLKGI